MNVIPCITVVYFGSRMVPRVFFEEQSRQGVYITMYKNYEQCTIHLQQVSVSGLPFCKHRGTSQ